MKDIDNKKKIIAVITGVIVLAGIIITCTVGLNFGIEFQSTKKVEFNIGKQFEIDDIKQITSEVLKDKDIEIQKVEVYEDTLRITSIDFTEEEVNQLVTKINEKYETEIKKDDIEIVSIPNARGRDIIKPYIGPYALSLVITLVYMAVRYRKLNTGKIIGKTIAYAVLVQLVFLSILAITRIPIATYVMPATIALYLMTLVVLTSIFEKENNRISDKKAQ